MKALLLVVTFITLSSCFMFTEQKSRPEAASAPAKSFYDFKMKAIDGKEIDFKKYKGKKLLIVNTASKCGFTKQYEALEQLHEKYGDKVVILGFPANNFGGQEPGSNGEIQEFCKKNYGVKFQMFEKISVTGEDQHPLYQWLSKKDLNGWNDQAPSWNFCKYLINENGELVKFYPSKVEPLDKDLLSAIGA
ncbi:glutathione peroxidase [Cytophagaceae bacterium DM2B3-1]|uniref:Glutathione peroxidase n=2 Tax=Xanthocytophaga TaxID=3078918 RepID=A0ABT7CK43_9BACT|nr:MULTISPECIES: glutathione peroxidase [Xanthocytophaga]MDJ1469406.1 glutathione peroxidase [Xanthocytophaga flavus]MDJ1494082.1 glutathione peroxidase [Xanthocytophaga flavus]MDJ1499231.1 glutathione peroxidase [Xanthocytophaga agilis]